MSKKRKGKILFSTADCFGGIVRCYAKQWKHVQERHPEMDGRIDDVQAAVEKPEEIRPSTLDEASFRFDRGVGTTDEVRVLVSYDTPNLFDGSSEGFVRTAFPPDPTYDRPHVGEVIWTATGGATGGKNGDSNKGGGE